MAASTKVSDMCRLCGTDTLNVVRHHIFEGEGQVKKSAQKISECLPLHIAAEDPLPKNICGECSYKLDLMSDFREKAVKTDVMLVSLVEGVKPEIPDDDDDGPDHEIDNDFRSDTPVEQPEQQTEPEVLIKEEEAQQPQQPEKRPGRKAANKRPIQESDMEEEEEEAPAKKRGRKPKEKETAPAASATTSASTNPPKENTGSVVCRICSERMTNFQAHMIERHAETMKYKCGLCNDLFFGMSSFQAHMPIHENRVKQSAKYQCDFKEGCMRFFERRHLLMHLANDHSIKNKTQYNQCTLCDLVFAWKHNLEKHLDKIHNVVIWHKKPAKLEITCTVDGTLRCNFCPEKFSSKEIIEKHIEVHLRALECSGVPFGCSACNFFSRAYGRLTIHYAQVHDTAWPRFPYECDLCSRKFNISTYYKYHMQRHSGVFQKCNICGKQCPSTLALKRHHEFCHSQKKHVCEVCGAAFRRSIEFKMHKHFHNEQLLKCLLCDYTTYNLIHLRGHMETHFKQKKKCNICTRTVYNMRSHMKWKHSSEKREHPCKICGKKYSTSTSYKYHMESVHLDRKAFQCDVCAEFFHSVAKMRTHRRKEHGIMPHECTICQEGFMTPTQLKSHRAKTHRNKSD
ncbi:zinc finger protein 728-like isoform X7 [Cloeon dipterum]|uniref:zinc finger protein 728-like isoform X7 n=1 Tax=Cloeon dipterum TaxID=197152 RepID=UPI00321FFBB4